MKKTYGLWLLLFLGLLLIAGSLQAVESKEKPLTALEVKLTEQVEELTAKNEKLKTENRGLIKSWWSPIIQSGVLFLAALIGLAGVLFKINSDHKKLAKEKKLEAEQVKREKRREEFEELFSLTSSIQVHFLSKLIDLHQAKEVKNKTVSHVLEYAELLNSLARVETLSTILLPGLIGFYQLFSPIINNILEQTHAVMNLIGTKDYGAAKEKIALLTDSIQTQFDKARDILREEKHNYI